MLVSEVFQQPAYQLPLAWTDDDVLRALLRRILPAQHFAVLATEMESFEVRLAGPIHKLALLADGPGAEPTVTQFDHFGVRVDELYTSEGWRGLKAVTAVEGLVSESFERRWGPYSRISAFAKTFLWVPESRYVSCPNSMSDGLARVMELAGTEEMKKEIIPRIISRDPAIAWTGAQMMTESIGGSDVSLTETFAVPVDQSKDYVAKSGDPFILNGAKWFSSACEGDVALALARTAAPGSGSRGLSLFLIKLRKADGSFNGIRIHRLKKKVGTKALPTAELEIIDCQAQLVGDLGRGVPIISTVLNITRVHSAMSAIGAARRALQIAKAFARVRKVGGEQGSLLYLNPMHTNGLATLETAFRALLHFEFGVVALLGRNECVPVEQQTTQEKHLLRLFTPVVKAFSANLVSKMMPNCMEALGGQGYMTENELGRLMMDAVVENIWEGTAETLALDIVRVIKQSKGEAIVSFIAWGKSILSTVPTSLDLCASIATLQAGFTILSHATQTFLRPSHTPDPRIATPLLMLLGYLASSLYLIEQAVWSSSRPDSEDGATDQFVVMSWTGVGGIAETMATLQRVLGSSTGAEEMQREAVLVYGRASKL